MRSRARSLGWLLLLPLLAGCPPPTPEKTQKSGPAAKTGAGAPTKTGGGAPVGGSTDPTPTAGDAPEGHWPLISKGLATHPDFYKQLTHLTSWPAPRSLTPLAEVGAAKKPRPVDLSNLRELVALIVKPRLRPTNVDSALGVDADGRLHMKLGAGKASGSASLQVKPEQSSYPVFCMTFEGPTYGATTIEGLRARVADVVVPSLAKALKQKDHRIEAWPQLKGDGEVAGMALLDRQSEHGIQFPYLYGFANKTHLTVLLQEVPHRKAPGSKPR